MSSSLATAALAKLGDTSQESSEALEGVSPAMGDALQEVWSAVKEDNQEAFVEALHNAVSIKMSEAK